ncbi:unnamed protein product [Rhizophagus irregularis]|uniref:Uncharacterized protein n=1 Tax=Rhizophagus irregularis TaxID=588596 RepID=A0A915ZLW0_9GLOM|nr:unnamed protein product [Rhizophagus irregularis]CAB5379752.1 unnamed protein product [Rhizophagus irregularis]
MSLAKTSIQIAVAESATAELIGILMQFIMKYHNNTALKYHKAKGHPPKYYKLSVEDNNQTMAKLNEGGLKTCSYYLGREHNIRECAKHKADKKNVNQHNINS